MSAVNSIFATPLLRVDTQTGVLASELRDLILRFEAEKYRKKNSPQMMHRAVLESEFDFLSWDYDEIRKLRDVFFGYLGGFVSEVNKAGKEQIRRLRFDHHCWFHITRSGGYFQPHNHALASWSLVYCVDPGDDSPKDDRSAGHIVFGDPRSSNMYLDPANRDMQREYSFDLVRFRLSVGELLIFPSYLLHWVEPYEGERPRITIAANFWFRSV